MLTKPACTKSCGRRVVAPDLEGLLDEQRRARRWPRGRTRGRRARSGPRRRARPAAGRPGPSARRRSRASASRSRPRPRSRPRSPGCVRLGSRSRAGISSRIETTMYARERRHDGLGRLDAELQNRLKNAKPHGHEERQHDAVAAEDRQRLPRRVVGRLDQRDAGAQRGPGAEAGPAPRCSPSHLDALRVVAAHEDAGLLDAPRCAAGSRRSART